MATITAMDVRALRAQRYAEITRETRSFGRVELRQTDGGDWEFEGLASSTNTPYEVEDWLGSYTEEFLSGAFTKTIGERADVAFLVNHEGLPLARTTSGTLDLREEDPGLMARATLAAADLDVQRIVPKMQRGDLSKMSIAFRATRQEWDEDYTYRKILEARLYDVSVVTFPANPGTWAAVRDADLVLQLAELDPADLLTQVRSGRSPVTREVAERAGAVLESITRVWLDDPAGDADEDRDGEPDEASSDAERDTTSTLSIEKARRNLELVRLQAHR
jgi:hypothetical protein